MMGQVRHSKSMRQTLHLPSIIGKGGSPSPLHPMCTRLWSQWITSSLFVHFIVAAFTADMTDTGKRERSAKQSRTSNAFWTNLYAQAHTHTLWGIRCKALTNRFCSIIYAGEWTIVLVGMTVMKTSDDMFLVVATFPIFLNECCSFMPSEAGAPQDTNASSLSSAYFSSTLHCWYAW